MMIKQIENIYIPNFLTAFIFYFYRRNVYKKFSL